MSRESGPAFEVEVADGVATVTLDRPPVNAISASTYEELHRLAEQLDTDDGVRVVVLTAPPDARAWCGGADLNDFVGMNTERRKARYEYVNAALPRWNALTKPTIAAINGHVVGVGVLLAAACDLRFAADDATFACPEVEYGLVAGSARLLNYLGVPEAIVRELCYTGRRLSASRMLASGFLNDTTSREEVLARARETAAVIASKDPATLAARKRTFIEHETLSWFDAYRLAQHESGLLVASKAARDGVDAFLAGDSSIATEESS